MARPAQRTAVGVQNDEHGGGQLTHIAIPKAQAGAQ